MPTPAARLKRASTTQSIGRQSLALSALLALTSCLMMTPAIADPGVSPAATAVPDRCGDTIAIAATGADGVPSLIGDGYADADRFEKLAASSQDLYLITLRASGACDRDARKDELGGYLAIWKAALDRFYSKRARTSAMLAHKLFVRCAKRNGGTDLGTRCDTMAQKVTDLLVAWGPDS